MNENLHLDSEEHSTYEEGIHLNMKEKLTVLAIIAGLGFMMLLVLIGIGF